MAKTELTNLSAAMADAVEKAGASTALVNGRERFPASGVAYAANLILTADHVVERDEDITVILPDGTEHSATIAGRDPGNDLALLRLEKSAATPAEKASDGRVGQLAIAVGRPTGEGLQASLGIVSAVGGPVRTARGGMLEKFIRTDAIPYPGFSGGPLVDAEGRVLGINTSGLGGNSIAIPAELVWRIADMLDKHGSVKRGYLGIRSQPVEMPNKAKPSLGREQDFALLIMGVEEGSPAAQAGLMIGDIIVGFNGQPVVDHDDLFALMVGDVVGKATPLEILRGGKLEKVNVTLAEREEPTDRKRRFRGGFHPGRRRMFWRGYRGPRPRTWTYKIEEDDDDDDE